MSHEAQKTITTWYVDPDAEDRMADGHAPIWRHLVGLIVERDLSEKNVLDFGCNQGGLLRHLYAIRPFRKALGIDIAEQSIAKAETLKGNIPVQHLVERSKAGSTSSIWRSAMRSFTSSRTSTHMPPTSSRL